MRSAVTGSFTLLLCALLFGCSDETRTGPVADQIPPLTREEQRKTIADLSPPKRTRPVIAVFTDNAGTETTDFLLPYGVLTESGVADVFAVAPDRSPIQLMPALTILPQKTIDEFDAKYPTGADYVIVPAMHRTDSPRVLSWIRDQAKRGAILVGICSGALVLAEAGLLDHHRATTHWFEIDALERRVPTLTRVNDRRYVVDRGVVTTTGVSASVPVSMALVEAIGGKAIATELAHRIGASEDWRPSHKSSDFQLRWSFAWVGLRNWLAFWNRDTIPLHVAAGVDEIALAFAADAHSRTYRSRAIAVADSQAPIRTKRGLLLIPIKGRAETPRNEVEFLAGNALPVHSLDRSIQEIASRYGRDVASLVALQMEYAMPIERDKAVGVSGSEAR